MNGSGKGEEGNRRCKKEKVREKEAMLESNALIRLLTPGKREMIK